MSNPSKAKGTRAESAVVLYAREHGFPLADRLTLSGRYDRGDIQLTVGAIVEVKAGKAAQAASPAQIAAWLEETETERVNAHADIAVLVTQRRGHGLTRVGAWECWFDAGVTLPWVHCMTLWAGLECLRLNGWGDPL